MSSERRNGPGNPWKPGVSGNPAGRPRKGESIAEVARTDAPAEWIVERMKYLALNAHDERTQFQATAWLADRGYGKVKEVVEHQTTLTDDEYVEECREIAREYLAKLTPEERMQLESPTTTDTIQ